MHYHVQRAVASDVEPVRGSLNDSTTLMDMRTVPSEAELPEEMQVVDWLKRRHPQLAAILKPNAEHDKATLVVWHWERLWRRAPALAEALVYLAHDDNDFAIIDLWTCSAHAWTTFQLSSPNVRTIDDSAGPASDRSSTFAALLRPVIVDAVGQEWARRRLATTFGSEEVSAGNYRLALPHIHGLMAAVGAFDLSLLALSMPERFLLYALHIGMHMDGKYDACIFGLDVVHKKRQRRTGGHLARLSKDRLARRRVRAVPWERLVAIFTFIVPRAVPTVQDVFDAVLSLSRRQFVTDTLSGNAVANKKRTARDCAVYCHVLSEQTIAALAHHDRFDLNAHIYTP